MDRQTNSEISTELNEGVGAIVGKIALKAAKKFGTKFAMSAGTDIVEDLAKELLDSGNMEKFIFEAFEHLDIKNAPAILGLLFDTGKDIVLKDRALTEEDKDTLVRKLNIDRDLLDGVDTVASAISAVLEVAPTALGILWDVFEIGPIDEALGLTLGGWGAVIFGILSLIPEGTLVGMLASASISIQKKVLSWIKDIVINDIIPEPADVETFHAELAECANKRTLSESLTRGKTSFAEEFRLYESLWD